jgi:hypothetical protein
MRILIASVAVAASFSAPSAAMASDDFKVQVLTRALAYRECVESYARAHSGPGASPTEIADASNVRCQKQFEEFMAAASPLAASCTSFKLWVICVCRYDFA